MEWDQNPLLKEERVVKASRSSNRTLYDWTDSGGVSILRWRGHVIGSAFADGRYRLQWRDKVHEGQAASRSQAIRFMSRWTAARGLETPLIAAKEKRSLVVPLSDFLRVYDDGKI